MKIQTDEITFEHAYAGQFLREYKSDPNNTNSLVNSLFATSTVLSLAANITVPSDAVEFPDVSF